MSTAVKKNIEQPLGRTLSHLGRSYLALMNARLSHLDIDRSYYALLIIEQGQGEITQQELAGLLDTDKVSIVRIIDYLSDNGYVERVKDPGDRRKYGLVLTEKAKNALPEILKSIVESNSIALKNLSPQQVEAFYETLKIIKENLNGE